MYIYNLMILYKKFFFVISIITTALFISTIYDLHLYDKKNKKLSYLKSQYIKIVILSGAIAIISFNFFTFI